MRRSHVIEVDGTFMGAGIDEGTWFRFIAIDPAVEEIDHSRWPSLAALRDGVARVARRATTAPPRLVVVPGLTPHR